MTVRPREHYYGALCHQERFLTCGRHRSWRCVGRFGQRTKLLDLCGVADDAERETVLSLGDEAKKRGKRSPHYDVLPQSY